MDINSVSSNKIVLNIRTPQGGELPLNKGEVVQAQVQDVGEDGLVTIVVKGKPIEAATEVAVKPGQQLLLMVDDVRNGKTYLKVVTPEMMGKIENTNISASLLDMGIAAKDDTILLSRKLLQYNLPVNQNSLTELNKNVKMLGGMNPRNLEIAAFALSRGITGKVALESLAQFLSQQADTAKLMPVLNQVLSILGKSTDQSQDDLAAAQGRSSSAPIPNESTNTADRAAAPLNQPGREPAESKGQKNSAAQANSADSAKIIADGELNRNAEPSPGSKTSGSPEATKQSMNTPSTNAENTPEPVNKATAASSENKGVQPNLVITVTEGEEPNPTAKTASPVNADVPAEESQPGPKLNAGNNKVPSDQLQEPASSRNTVIRDETSAPRANKTGNENSMATAMKPESETAAEDGNKPPDTVNRNSKPTANANANEAVSQKALADPDNNVEQLAGTRASRAPAANQEPNSTSASLAMPASDESLERPVGIDASSILRGLENDLDSPQKSLSQKITNLLDTLRTIMDIDPEAPTDKIAGQIQEAVSAEKDIIKALTLLKDIIVNKDIADRMPQIKDFSLGLNNLEKELAGQQLYNVSSKYTNDNVSSYYFSFPVPTDQGYSLCQLQINKDSRHKLRDVDKLSFVVSLNTAKLGMVLFHVNWQKIGQLELQGVAENEASCAYLNKNTDELVKSLEGLGYRVKHKGVKTASPEEPINLKPVLQEVNEPLRPLGIDVTV